MSAAELAAKGAAESAADRAYQEQLLDPKNRARGPHPMLRQVRTRNRHLWLKLAGAAPGCRLQPEGNCSRRDSVALRCKYPAAIDVTLLNAAATPCRLKQIQQHASGIHDKLCRCLAKVHDPVCQLLCVCVTQVAGGVDTGLDRLGLARPQEQLDEQTRRFREQVGLGCLHTLLGLACVNTS